MNRALIERWNKVVGERDEVWFLGDFAFHPNGPDTDEIPWLFGALSGHKHLVIGNHDAQNKQVLRLAWNEIEQLKDLKVNKARLTLCHYPLTTWPASHHGSISLHGHCHGTLRQRLPKRFDVGVDVEPHPLALEVILERAALEAWQPTDGHGVTSLEEEDDGTLGDS